MTTGEAIAIYASSVRELDDAQDAFMDKPDEETFRRFWLARERYQALTQRLARDLLWVDAVEAYR